MEIFGGKLNRDSINVIVAKSDGVVDPMWIYFNFNDFSSGMISLFAMMFLNDWQDYLRMYSLIWDDQYNILVATYWISFMLISWYIILNILVAYVIDTYSQLEEATAEQER